MTFDDRLRQRQAEHNLQAQIMSEIENLDYPVPDPEWAYADLYPYLGPAGASTQKVTVSHINAKVSRMS